MARRPPPPRHQEAETPFARDERRSGGQMAAALVSEFGGIGLLVGRVMHGRRWRPITVPKLTNIWQISLSFNVGALLPAIFFDSDAEIEDKPGHGQENRDQSQRRVCLLQYRL